MFISAHTQIKSLTDVFYTIFFPSVHTLLRITSDRQSEGQRETERDRARERGENIIRGTHPWPAERKQLSDTQYKRQNTKTVIGAYFLIEKNTESGFKFDVKMALFQKTLSFLPLLRNANTANVSKHFCQAPDSKGMPYLVVVYDHH